VVEGFEAVEFLDGARPRGHPEWFGLSPIASAEGPDVGGIGEAVEAFGEEVVAVPGLGDLGIPVDRFGADSHAGLGVWGVGSGGLVGVGAVGGEWFAGYGLLGERHLGYLLT
jgi:hypothetical protein